jgi:hypothetical protein
MSSKAEMSLEDTNKASGKSNDVPIAARSIVNVQRAGCEMRIKAQVLGAVPGAYIVLREVASGGRAEHRLSAISPRVGDTLLVRFLHEGVVFGFRAGVARIVMEPEYLLFISYPIRVERFSVRQQRRWVCSIPCAITVGEKADHGLMTDVNDSGCSIVGKVQKDSVLPEADHPLKIMLRTPDSDHPFTVKGMVRRIDATETVWQAGIVFDEAQQQMLEALMPYLLIDAKR